MLRDRLIPNFMRMLKLLLLIACRIMNIRIIYSRPTQPATPSLHKETIKISIYRNH